MRAYELVYRAKPLLEGGNLEVGGKQAHQIDLNKLNRSKMTATLNQLISSIDSAYKKMFGDHLWSPDVLKKQNFLSGSSSHFFNVQGISDSDFVSKKSRVGDIDTMVDKTKEANLEQFLKTMTGQQIGPATLVGFKPGNEQFSSLWSLTDPEINVQIDLEFVDYEQDAPTDWSRFSHSSSWQDLQAGVKGVFHKFLIQSLAALTQREFLLRKLVGRGKARAEQDVPTTDNLYSFAISSKEGGGLRSKYEPVLDDNGEPLVVDGLPVMKEAPTAGYIKDISKIFSTLLGKRIQDPAKVREQLWSFTGLAQLLAKSLNPKEKQRVFTAFLKKTVMPGAQGLYKNDPARDIAEKSVAIDVLLKTLGIKPTDDVEQLKQQYQQNYKMTESLTEAAPSYKRKGIQHLYNRLPDGRKSSMEMSDNDFIDLTKEIAAQGGKLDGIAINLKVDGAGIRFGRDQQGRPFFMTSRVDTPIYGEDSDFFTKYASSQGQNEAQMARARNYDQALALITGSKFIQALPKDTIVQSEMLFNPMAEKTPDGLKFVNISYDPKKLGGKMTLVPFEVKTYSSGEPRSDSDSIIKNLLAASDSNVKIISNRLKHKGIDVSKIIAPVTKLEHGAGKTNAEVLDQARQKLSDAIINSPELKGADMLGDNMEGIVVNMPSGPFKVTSSKMKAAMAAKQQTVQYDKTPRTAVVAIGNFAGHRGHEQLINYAVEKAKELGGDPFVFVGHKVGVDDPIDIETKLKTLKKLFPNVTVSVVKNQIDPASGAEVPGDIFKKIEYELAKGTPHYNNIVVTVGSDQEKLAKRIQSMQDRFSKWPPLAHVKVSLYVTPRESGKGGTGISTTELRNALRDLPEDQAFDVWKRAYNVNKLGEPWIRHLMDVSRKNMGLHK